MRFPCRSKIAALVIVLMALSSVAPLAYTHQHEVTACQEDQDHEHSHGHCHHHCHAHDSGPPAAAMLSPHTHEHVFWWGLEFVVASDSSSDSGDAPSRFDESQIGALTSRTTTATVELTTFPSPELAATTLALVSDVALSASARDRAAAPRPENNLLCDSARFERSGVQLL